MPGTVTGLVLAGVATQPVLATARILAVAALEAGFDVTCSECPSPMRRSGALAVHVRMGPEVRSPLIREGEADFLLAFEELEGSRAAPLLARGGLAVVERRIVPTWRMRAGLDPTPSGTSASLRRITPRVVEVSTASLLPAGASRDLAGLVLLGLVAPLLSIPAGAIAAALATEARGSLAAWLQAFAAGGGFFDALPPELTRRTPPQSNRPA